MVEIIDKRKEKKIPFSKIKVGDYFIDEKYFLYIKTEKRYGVKLLDGKICYFSDDDDYVELVNNVKIDISRG